MANRTQVIQAIKTPISTFTRPSNTTAYAANDMVANSATPANVVPMKFSGIVGIAEFSASIVKCKLSKSNTSGTNIPFKVHFFTQKPTVASSSGDNNAFKTTDKDIYIGACDVTPNFTFDDGVVGEGLPENGFELPFSLQEANSTIGTPSEIYLYALLEVEASYTPASGEVFIVQPTIYMLG